jgi:hypothetical protein
MEVVLSGGKEYAAIEVMRPHCSNYATVETLPLLDGGPRRSGNSVYLDGRRRAGPRSWLRFFLIFENRFWVSAGNSRYEK